MKRWFITLIIFSGILEVSTAAPQFRFVARTGDKIVEHILPVVDPIISFGHWVSMNDTGQVAFKAKLQSGTELIVKASPNAQGEYDLENSDFTEVVETADGSIISFGDYVGINSTGQTSFRRKSSAGQVSFSIRRDLTRIAFGTTVDTYNWYFRGLMSPTDVSSAGKGMVSFNGTVLENYKTYTQIRKGDSSTIYHEGGKKDTILVATQTLPTEAGFTSLNQFTGINDSGYVVFTGKHPTEGDGIFIGQGDNKWDKAGPYTVVAASTTGFQTVGQKPSINNANQIAFYGIKGTEEGIFIWDNMTLKCQVAIEDPVLNIDPTSRVAMNDYSYVAFLGTNTDNIRSLFRNGGSGSEPLVSLGDEIDGYASIDALELWDGLNNNGGIAFWCHHSDGSESVVTEKVTQYKLRYFDGDYPSREVKGFAADGAAQIILQIEGLPSTAIASDITIQFTPVDDCSFVNQGSLSNGFYTRKLQAPPIFVRDDSHKNIPKRQLVFTINFQGNIIPHPPLLLTKAPVALLHGIWGDRSTWKDFQSYLKNIHGYPYVFNSSYPNDLHFEDLKFVPRNYAILANQLAQKDNIVSKKVDFVTHSMGGVLTKLYGNSTYIKSITTVGTPHFGTPAADRLWEMVDEAKTKPNEQKVLDLWINSWQNIIGGIQDPRKGAVEDLRENGGVHVDKNEIQVPTLTIYGLSPFPSWTNPLTNRDNRNKWFFLGRLRNSLAFFQNDNKYHGYTEDQLNSDIFKQAYPYNDWLVPISSQCGPGQGEGFVVNWHCSEPDEIMVQNRIVEFLDNSTTSLPPSSFEEIGFTQDYQNNTFPDDFLKGQPLEMSNNPIKISFPNPDQVFSPGDSVNVSIDVVDPNAMILFGASTQDSALLTEPPYQYQLSIPEDMIGPVILYAAGQTKTHDLGDDKIIIQVASFAQLNALTVYPEDDSLCLLPKSIIQLTVVGSYSDGIERNISSSECGTEYLLDSQGIATVSSIGEIRPNQSGQAILTIQNGSLSKQITLRVLPPDNLADFNHDGLVTITDFEILANSWQITPCMDTLCQSADLDKSGIVDLDDLVLFADQWLAKSVVLCF